MGIASLAFIAAASYAVRYGHRLYNSTLNEPGVQSYLVDVIPCIYLDSSWKVDSTGELQMKNLAKLQETFRSDSNSRENKVWDALVELSRQFKPKQILTMYCVALLDTALRKPATVAQLYKEYVFALPQSWLNGIPTILPKVSARKFQERVLESIFSNLYYDVFYTQLVRVSKSLINIDGFLVIKDFLFCSVLRCISAFWHKPEFPADVMLNVVYAALNIIEYQISNFYILDDVRILKHISVELSWSTALGHNEWFGTARRAQYLLQLAQEVDPKSPFVLELEKMAGVGAELSPTSLFIPVSATRLEDLRKDPPDEIAKLQTVAINWTDTGVHVSGPLRDVTKARIALVKSAVRLRRLAEHIVLPRGGSFVLVPIERSQYCYLRLQSDNVRLHDTKNTKSDPFLSQLVIHSYVPREVRVDIIDIERNPSDLGIVLDSMRAEAAKLLDCDPSSLQLSTYALSRTLIFKVDKSFLENISSIGSSEHVRDLILAKKIEPTIVIGCPMSWVMRTSNSLRENGFSHGQDRLTCTVSGFVRDQESSTPQWRKFVSEIAVNLTAPPAAETSAVRGLLGCGGRLTIPVTDSRGQYPGMAIQLRLRFSELPRHDINPMVPMGSADEAEDAPDTAPESPGHLATYLKYKIRQSRSFDDIKKSMSSTSLRTATGFFGSQTNLGSPVNSPRREDHSDAVPEYAQSPVTGAAVATVDREYHSYRQLPLLNKTRHKRADSISSTTSSVLHIYPSMLEKWLADVYLSFLELHSQLTHTDEVPVEWMGNLCVPSLAQYDPAVLCPSEEGIFANGRPVCRLEATHAVYYRRADFIMKRCGEFWWFTKDHTWDMSSPDAPDLYTLPLDHNTASKSLIRFLDEIHGVLRGVPKSDDEHEHHDDYHMFV